MTDEMIVRDPNELLTYKRFDVVIKYLYACNLSSKYYTSMYYEHQSRWNGFSQKEPLKVGFDEFDRVFKSIINNTVDEPVPVSNQGHIANGGHRLAAALYHQRPINTRRTTPEESYDIIADYEFFLRRNLPRHMFGTTAIEYAKLKPNSHVICLFPIAHTRIDKVMSIIEKWSNIFYATTEEFNATGQLGLMKELYSAELANQSAWANEEGIKEKGDKCFRGFTKATFLLVDANKLEDAKKMKAEIRELFDVGNHSVHVSDFHEDAIRISKTVFNANSIHFLNHRKNNKYKKLTELMADMKPDDNKVITGSTVLTMYGLRECGDVDLIYYNDPPANSHNLYLKTEDKKGEYNLTVDDIVNNPLFHFYYQGFKYASLDVVKNMKKARNEPKDIIDLELIAKVTPMGRSNNIVEINTPASRAAPNMSAFMEMFRKRGGKVKALR